MIFFYFFLPILFTSLTSQAFSCSDLFIKHSSWKGFVGSDLIELHEIPMDKEFFGETKEVQLAPKEHKRIPNPTPGDTDLIKDNAQNSFIFTTKRMRYLTNEELKKIEITLDPKTGLFFWSNGLLVDFSKENSSPIFIAIKSNYDIKLYVHPEFEMYVLHHSSLSGGAPVLMAGHIGFSKGKIIYLSNHSGHYKPSIQSFDEFKNWLKSMGADLSHTEFSEISFDKKY